MHPARHTRVLVPPDAEGTTRRLCDNPVTRTTCKCTNAEQSVFKLMFVGQLWEALGRLWAALDSHRFGRLEASVEERMLTDELFASS